MLIDLRHLREEYASGKLDEQDAPADPIVLFTKWMNEAIQAQIPEPNAMTLATVNSLGRPTARVVLLKSFDRKGFVFFTNYQSNKGKELAENPYGALVFNWLELHRQVRIEGSVEKISEEESTAYFAERPRGSQIGAWASPQSSPIPNRTYLETEFNQWEQKFKNEEHLPRPPQWGGYLLRPERIEFWQGRVSRLHDRLSYSLQNGHQGWSLERLAP